ncbi:histidine kinase [Isoptericola sp. b515]|uniref:sensor histidine kinase n=1 Tax=Isoptericola sp. b515 TaxID=3064652 RepID=UPI002713B32E|nr:histidine kinase [Isoptericola sp. b515]MDO8147952.1 histidine kinase [Isoptericola sp. b515]
MGWSGRVNRWFEGHRFGVDAVGAGTLALAVLVSATDLSGAGRGPAVLAWSLALVVPLAWRRTHPVASVVAVYAVGLAHLLSGLPLLLPGDVAVLAALWAVTVYGPRWAHVTAIVSAVAGCFLLGPVLVLQDAWFGGLADTLGISLFCSTVALAVWALALVRRYRRVTVEALRDRAERLEVERDQQARIATAAERARIAREMHDIVAHSLSIVVAQADGGRYAASADPQAAVRALGVVSETGRAALADMRRLLGVLRDDDAATSRAPVPAGAGRTADESLPVGPDGPTGPTEASPPAPAPLRPQPDDAELDGLVQQSRGAGMRVSLVRVGTARRLPPGAGLTLHRVTQEALSNVRKHAGPRPQVTVVLRWTADAVTVDVTDDGRGAAAVSHGRPGFGLLGMRERAAVFGGNVTAGPRPGGGWRVRFVLPVPASAPAATGPSEDIEEPV